MCVICVLSLPSRAQCKTKSREAQCEVKSREVRIKRGKKITRKTQASGQRQQEKQLRSASVIRSSTHRCQDAGRDRRDSQKFQGRSQRTHTVNALALAVTTLWWCASSCWGKKHLQRDSKQKNEKKNEKKIEKKVELVTNTYYYYGFLITFQRTTVIYLVTTLLHRLKPLKCVVKHCFQQ